MTREAPLTHPRNGLVVGSRRHLWPPPAKQMRMSSLLEVGTHCVGITMITTSSPVFAFPGSCWVLIQNKFTLNIIRSAYLRLGHAFPTCSHAMPCQSFHTWNSVEWVLGRHFSVGDLPCFLVSSLQPTKGRDWRFTRKDCCSADGFGRHFPESHFGLLWGTPLPKWQSDLRLDLNIFQHVSTMSRFNKNTAIVVWDFGDVAT